MRILCVDIAWVPPDDDDVGNDVGDRRRLAPSIITYLSIMHLQIYIGPRNKVLGLFIFF